MDNKSIGQLRFENSWDGIYQPNKSSKCKKLYHMIEDKGQTNIYVWYETIRTIGDMVGINGGYLCVSDQEEMWWLGFDFEEAMDNIRLSK